MADTEAASVGVQELIGRLREEGVQAGRQEADRVLEEARKRATQLVDKAKKEAEEVRAKARAEIESERAAALDALHVAARDTQLRLRELVKSAFATRVRRLVSEELHDKELLRQMILAVAGRAASGIKEGQAVEVLVPEQLRQFLLSVTGGMMRDGLEIKPSGDGGAGIRVRLVGEDLEIDLSDKAISDLLLKHLTPRYRTILLGVE